MTQPIAIEFTDDPRLDPFRFVRDRDFARLHLFCGESPLVVERMLALPGVTVAVLGEPERAAWAATRAEPEVSVYAVSRSVLQDVLGYRFHRGVVALGRRAGVADLPLATVIPSTSRGTVPSNTMLNALASFRMNP